MGDTEKLLELFFEQLLGQACQTFDPQAACDPFDCFFFVAQIVIFVKQQFNHFTYFYLCFNVLGVNYHICIESHNTKKKKKKNCRNKTEIFWFRYSQLILLVHKHAKKRKCFSL